MRLGPFFLGLLLICGASLQAQVFDCFLFFNELDLLEVRLYELYDHVDKFVIVESTETFKGRPKELHFEKNKGRFSQYLDKIIHLVVPLNRSTCERERKQNFNQRRERFQRNAIMQALGGCCDDDIILISDLDEIFRPSALEKGVKKLENRECDSVAFEMRLYRYYLDRYHCGWKAAGATTYGYLKTINPQKFRTIITGWGETRQFSRPHLIKNGGWHFTYMGGHEKVIEKIAAFSHVEGKRQHWSVDPQTIKKTIDNQTTQTRIDATYPRFIWENIGYFEKKGYIYRGKKPN